MRIDYRKWFVRAMEDHDLALFLLESKRFFHSIYFHSHECVEKALKGFLLKK